MDPKQQIIDRLNRSEAFVSGETLSDALGISRVAVWKHIQGLVQSGVPISASPKGYRLNSRPDDLMPWAFGSRKARVHFFAETSSTMDEAGLLARRGCPDFSVVIAQRQTRGRGRMQRSWLSADGGLYFTVVVRPEIPMLLTGLVNLAAAVDMADVLRSAYGVDARLKWPNDILVGQRKICGVLSQMAVEGERVEYLNIGVGLNVNNAPQEEEPIAISLKALLGKSVPRREILTAFLDRFETRVGDFNPRRVIDQWKANNVTLGREVRVFTINQHVEGRAVDIDSHGGLILATADGGRQTVLVGDCFHR